MQWLMSTGHWVAVGTNTMSAVVGQQLNEMTYM